MAELPPSVSGKEKRSLSEFLSRMDRKANLYTRTRSRSDSESVTGSSTASCDEENSMGSGSRRFVPKRRKGRAMGYFMCGTIWSLTILGLVAMVDLALMISRSLWGLEDDPDKIFANWGKSGTGTEGLAWYPTDFLRDVQPIHCHSHNDYWRKVPLFSALHAGCIGVEADVWLYDNSNSTTLYVGHNRASLTEARTFQSLYINPIVDILERANPQTRFTTDKNETTRGVFDVDPAQSLTLLVDVKTDGAKTWPEVLKQLEPLRSRGWLTYVENVTVHPGQVTVVGTGNTPFDLLTANATYRDAFFDAPLDKMWEDPDSNVPVTTPTVYNSTNSHYASVSFGSAVGRVWAGLTKEQLRTIRGHVKGAHRRGLTVRYWDLPAWPIGLRNSVWHALTTEGVDMLNVDDLRGAARKSW
ncbi:Altered inheritance of mitochondria protein 6-like protein [Apiospora sp. TS-2023a]